VKKILVTYATMAGSTAEVAEAVCEALAAEGCAPDLKPLQAVADIEGYDAVIIGGPMILGWHRHARRFLRAHSSALAHIPFALFATAMSLTETDARRLNGVGIYIDEKLAEPPAEPSRLTIRERYASVSNYLRPILRSARPAKPTSVAFFGGRLNYGRLTWWAVLFAMLIVRAQAGDKRNWESIRAWAKGLPAELGVEP
jgi:menaquinone-dependent protoporphyrinogen oxidase